MRVEPMPSTFLEELAADWPTPAKHSTLEDLHRMALLIAASMPPQHEQSSSTLLKRSTGRMTIDSLLHAPASQTVLHQDVAASLRTQVKAFTHWKEQFWTLDVTLNTFLVACLVVETQWKWTFSVLRH